MPQTIINNGQERMDKTLESLKKELQSVKTGRANPSVLNKVEVVYYGSPMPLNQVATISAPEAQILMIKPYDKNLLRDIEKAILVADLNLTPQNDGTVIRLNIPALSQERRKEYCKLCGKLSEAAKVSIRNIRRNANETLKRDKTMPEDQRRRVEQDVQKATDEFIKKIDQLASAKEKEIMTI